MPDISHSVKYTLEVAGAAEATSELQRVGGAATSTTGATGGLSGAFGGLAGQFAAGNIMAQAATQAIGALKQAAQQLLTNAISLTVEMADLADAMGYIYEDAAPQLIDNLDAISASSGYARSELYGLTRDIGAMIAPMGLSSDAAADMSSNIVRASTDAAAALGMDLSQASGAMEAALRGSSRAARQLGIDISEDAVQAELLSMGVTTAASDTDEATLIQARYNIAMEATARYAGAAAAEMDTLEGAQRSLATAYENAATELGDKMGPALETILGFLENMLPQITVLAEVILTGLYTALAPIIVMLNNTAETSNLLIDIFNSLAEALGINISPLEIVASLVEKINSASEWCHDLIRNLLGVQEEEVTILGIQASALDTLYTKQGTFNEQIKTATIAELEYVTALLTRLNVMGMMDPAIEAASARLRVLRSEVDALLANAEAKWQEGKDAGLTTPTTTGGTGGGPELTDIEKKQAQALDWARQLVALNRDRVRYQTESAETEKEALQELYELELEQQEVLRNKYNEQAEEQYALQLQRNEEIASSIVDAFGVAMTDFEHFDEYVTDAIKKWAVEMMKAFAIEGLTNLLTGGMGGGLLTGGMGGGLKSLGQFVK